MPKRASLSSTAKKALEKRITRCLNDDILAVLAGELGDAAAAADAIWQAVEHDVFDLGSEWRLALAAAKTEIDAVRAEILSVHLARMAPYSGETTILPGWPWWLDRLVYRVCRAFPSAFEVPSSALASQKKIARSSHAPWATRGLVFVKRRLGLEVDPSDAAECALVLARGLAGGPLRGGPIPLLSDGRESAIEVVDVESLRAIAAAIDEGIAASDAWHEALVASTLENRWAGAAGVAPVLEKLPLGVLTAQLAARTCSTHGSYSDTFTMREALGVLEARSDRASDLWAEAVALSKVEEERAPALAPLTTLLAYQAARTEIAANEPVSAELEQRSSFDVVVTHEVLLPGFLDVLRSLPAERVLPWLRAACAKSGAAVAGLAAHFDGELLEEALQSGPTPWPRAIGVIGHRALPFVLAATSSSQAAIEPARRATLQHALVFVMDEMLASGMPPSPDLDLDLLVAAFDGRPMERLGHGGELRLATERLLAAMPLERRRVIFREAQDVAPMSASAMLPSIESDAELEEYLGRAIERGHVNGTILRELGARAVAPLRAHAPSSTQMPWVHDEAKLGLPPALFAQVADAFVPGSQWRLIEADAARALAASPNEPRRRVYLLERASMKFSARPGSSSRVGGAVPGLEKSAWPRDLGGETMAHLLTLDFADVPELAERFPKARAVVLFCQAGEGDAEDAELVEIRTSARARAPKPGSGGNLAVFGIEVPLSVVTRPETELGPEARAIRDRIRGAAGHVFGRPFWIHRSDEDASDGFLMQVNEELFEDPHSFDSLYVFAQAIFAETS